jgi:pyridoxal phosphate enzyme (YggS family)
MTAGRAPDSVELLAVSKTRTAAELREARLAGQRAFGENYLQEALDKMAELEDLTDLEWHFIGPIQSNKTRQIASTFQWVHSVDRLKIARRLSEQRDESLMPLNICIQVNIDREDSKSGCLPDDVAELAESIAALPCLTLRGLMAIPDPRATDGERRNSFRRMGELLEACRTRLADTSDLDTLSMGMSGDLEAAIEEGATIVRVGTDIFGERPAKS